jgi:hypothetical protein
MENCVQRSRFILFGQPPRSGLLDELISLSRNTDRFLDSAIDTKLVHAEFERLFEIFGARHHPTVF